MGRLLAILFALFAVMLFGLIVVLPILAATTALMISGPSMVMGPDAPSALFRCGWRGGFLLPVGAASIALLALVVAGVIWRGVSGGSRERRQRESDESRLMQEIYHGLERMEKRVEALETILMDQTGAPEADETERPNRHDT